MSQAGANLPVRYQHPLTEEFIKLVGGGLTPREAAMRLVGPLLPLKQVENVLFDWECDLGVSERIEALVAERVKAAQTVRHAAIERLIGIIGADVRQFFMKTGDPERPRITAVPVSEWTRGMSAAVKKVKFVQKTDPFGNTTETVNLEFHDPSRAIADLRDIAPEVFELVTRVEEDSTIDVEVLETMTEAELLALHTRLLKAV